MERLRKKARSNIKIHATKLVLNFPEMKLIDTHQVDLLHKLLHIRNNIVHKGYIELRMKLWEH
jgi:hypothetical protein